MGAKDKMKKKNRILFLLVILILMVNFFYTDSKIIRTSYKEYKAGNSSNLVLDKILSDNQLKQEIPHMFNYASNGNYVIYRDYNYEIVNDPNYVTNGLYSTEDDDGTSYYFRGDVNNNLVFGAYDEDYYVNIFDMGDEGGDNIYALLQNSDNCEEFMTDYIGDSDNVTEYCKYVKIKLASKGDEMSWKIVRVNGDGTLRLMYNGPGVTNLTNYWGIVYASNGNESIGKEGSIGNIPYNFDYYDPKYTGYTYDNGVDSFIKKEVDSWYNNTLGSNPLYDSKVIEGSNVDDNTAFEEELNLDGVTWTSEDESIAKIENGKILGLKEGTTTITGVSSDGLTNYLIEVNVIKNPVTNSMIYVGIGVILILVLGTVLYAVYRIKTIVKED